MDIEPTFIIIAAVFIGLWFFIELQKLRYRIIAIAIIILAVFFYFSFNFVQDEYVEEPEGVNGTIKSVDIYFSWLGHAYDNFKIITGNALKMNWTGNESEISSNSSKLLNFSEKYNLTKKIEDKIESDELEIPE